MTTLLEINNVNVSYDGSAVLHGATIRVEEGSVVGIAGESGSGKSTLIHAALGVLPEGGSVDSGSFFFEGQDLGAFSPKMRRRFLGERAALVSQSPQATFSPVRTIGSQYREVMRLRKGMSRKEADAASVKLLSRLGFDNPSEVLRSYVFELSGGMAQRAAIGMALVANPKLLFADEPTAALDVTVQAQVVGELMHINRELGTSIVVISHNIAVLTHMSDYLYVMKEGRIVEEGTTDQLIAHPSHPYTQMLMDAVPRFGGKQ